MISPNHTHDVIRIRSFQPSAILVFVVFCSNVTTADKYVPDTFNIRQSISIPIPGRMYKLRRERATQAKAPESVPTTRIR